jgi:glycosyltransferase involved in cell wall biosynthesis
MSEPLVSIIIPSYNDTKYLTDAISSALSQTYTNTEIIVVNDGSNKPQDIEFFKNYSDPKVRVISKKNEGLAMARNTGIAESKGEFFVPLDADDMIKHDFISKTIAVALADESVGVVYTDQEWFGDEPLFMPMKEYNFADLLSQNHVSVCSLVRRSVYDKVKEANGFGYNPNMKFGYEDWDFWISVGEMGVKFKCVHEPLFRYRRRGNSMSSNTIKYHNFLVNQMFENHQETYAKHHKDVILKLQNLYKERYVYSKNLERDMKSKAWLAKKFLKNLV